MDKTKLGNRMKECYENRSKIYLTRRTPVIIRLDGKAFHAFTKGLKKPFDNFLMEVMQETTKYLCENIQGCKLGYTQSDEISLLLTDYDKLTTDAWFDYNIQKIVSISASMATLAFNTIFAKKLSKIDNDDYLAILENKKYKALFDSRVFNIPKKEVNNYFLWRQKDASKNSISMVAQAYFSHKELHKKNGDDKQEMLFNKFGINWNDFSIPEKRGTCVIKKPIQIYEIVRNKWIIDKEIPIFNKNVKYIENLIY